MSEALVEQKRALRRALRARLAGLAPWAFVEAGRAVAVHMSPLLEGLPPRSFVAAFASRERELSTGPLLAAARARGHTVLLPRIDGDALAFVAVDDENALPRDRFGLAAPPAGAPSVPLTASGLVIVPGLGFDDAGRRIGFGRGFYDRALAAAGGVERAVGVFLDEQRVARVPAEAHDVRLARLCTPTRGLHVVVDP